MASGLPAPPITPGPDPRRRGVSERWLSPLILAPSLIAIFIFVYGFIGMTVWVSFSNWQSPVRDLSIIDPLFATYRRLFETTRFQIDIRNTIVFTFLFLAGSVGIGLMLAIALDRALPARALIRSIFLFPYALSFVVTGVAWRWIFNPESGISLLIENLGINWLLDKFGLGPVTIGWLISPEVWGNIPVPEAIKAQVGIPIAMLPVIIAAIWQLSGFAMAMYLAGLGTISNDIREAAALDGASTWQTYRHIIIPLLKPITISTLIILGHISLKIFDLIFAMSGKGPGFATDVPGIFVYEQSFGANRYNLGAAASVIMLILISLVMVPYLARSMKDVER
ncbi:MAG: carbohydrate ABC transporter permease [Thermomicrobiales bacterium]